ncbi:hypothetical protein IQ06DRAFT_60996 [Phaeosphaeriaceae sp. SRC1lsM3a]|nr:hypothetical protein IQ06DRAFT_60996 [Stagonospora sp. SRC1lsM3a]
MTNTTRPSTPSILVHESFARPQVPLRRVTCSFLEPIPEHRRSHSGKPYRPPRVKSPAPENMVNRMSLLRKLGPTRTNSMPVRINLLSKRARYFLKRRNSDAFRANANIDITDAKGWALKHGEV